MSTEFLEFSERLGQQDENSPKNSSITVCEFSLGGKNTEGKSDYCNRVSMFPLEHIYLIHFRVRLEAWNRQQWTDSKFQAYKFQQNFRNVLRVEKEKYFIQKYINTSTWSSRYVFARTKGVYLQIKEKQWNSE